MDFEHASSSSLSLSQRVYELRNQLNAKPDLIGDLYDALYLRHFGRAARRRHDARENTLFGRVFAWCARNDVPVSDFITSNMLVLRHTLPKRITKRVWSRGRWRERTILLHFQPNMLVGENAERRYNGVLGRANRRFQNGNIAVFDARETWVGVIRENLFQAELDVAELFVGLRLAGDEITWQEALALVQTNEDYRDFNARVGCYARLARTFGREAAAQEGMLATLSAAWTIAERHQHGLPDRIGVADFSWPALVQVIQHAVGAATHNEPIRELETSGASTWGNW